MLQLLRLDEAALIYVKYVETYSHYKYIKLKDTDQNKETTIYIDGRPKYLRYIVRFIYNK